MNGSDLHLKTDTGKVYVRIYGELMPLDDVPVFTDEEFHEALRAVLRPEQIKRFEDALELDFALEMPGVARFRGNLYQQRSHYQAVFRVIPFEIQSMEELHLPEAAFNFIERPRGLVLVTGPAGSGKSTSLAAMIVKLRNPTRELVVEGRRNVNALLVELDLNRESHLVIRNGTLVPGDGELAPDDVIEIRPVISGR